MMPVARQQVPRGGDQGAVGVGAKDEQPAQRPTGRRAEADEDPVAGEENIPPENARKERGPQFPRLHHRHGEEAMAIVHVERQPGRQERPEALGRQRVREHQAVVKVRDDRQRVTPQPPQQATIAPPWRPPRQRRQPREAEEPQVRGQKHRRPEQVLPGIDQLDQVHGEQRHGLQTRARQRPHTAQHPDREEHLARADQRQRDLSCAAGETGQRLDNQQVPRLGMQQLVDQSVVQPDRRYDGGQRNAEHHTPTSAAAA